MSLYTFDNLERFLDQNGFPKANPGEFQAIRRELVPSMSRGEITIQKDGIYLQIDGYEHRGYIFNQKPDISRYGAPKFHIADCEVVQNRSRLTGDYIWTNTEKVQLYDRGQNGIAYPQLGSLTTLGLCSKCNQLVDKLIVNIVTTDDFHHYLADQYGTIDLQEHIRTDIFGYTADWPLISRRYRETMNYYCERCNNDLSEATARRFLHVHHRSGKKTDNRAQNLECLCIRCHASVDERHKANFDKRRNQAELKAYNKRFPN